MSFRWLLLNFSQFYFLFVAESRTVPESGEEGLEDVGDELHEEIDLDDDEEDEVVEASQPQEQQQQPEGTVGARKQSVFGIWMVKCVRFSNGFRFSNGVRFSKGVRFLNGRH